MPAAEITSGTRYHIDKSVVRSVVNLFLVPFSLTKRETEVVVLLSEGIHAKEIAQHMSCSEKNVYALLTRACRKIGCRDYHVVVCAVLAFACDLLGHVPHDHATVNLDKTSICLVPGTVTSPGERRRGDVVLGRR